MEKQRQARLNDSEKDKIDMTDVSIIVPIYNSGAYLGKCLDSLAAQSYKDIEVLLVDDGSSDSSQQICREYCLKFPCFHYYYKDNGGLSDARNYGIERAAGKKLAFVDSDDYVDRDFILKLRNAAEETQAQIVCGGYYLEKNGERRTVTYPTSGVISPLKLWSSILSTEDIGNYIAYKLYAAELFEEVRFPFGKKYEDIFTFYRLADQCSRIAVVSEPLYHYIYRNSSLSHNYGRDNARDLMEACAQLCGYIRKKHPALKEQAELYLFLEHIYNLNALSKSGVYPGGEEWTASRKYICRHWKQVGEAEGKYRLSAWLIRLIPGIYSRLLHQKQKRMGT